MHDNSRNLNNTGNLAGVNQGDESEVEAKEIDQHFEYAHGVSEETLNNLKDEIIEHTNNEKEQEEVLGHYEKMRVALREHDKEKAKKYWGWIKDSIGMVGSLVTIGTVL
ncbi:hypothetical protein [Halobacillus litoralis]|uniref:Uncharacterized protein n=1 Tax=Halobacillus litoralis TaxID=45668 RepID=A0A410MCG8_9BACI|nr:hypothetical protein [Halobacillus litoralis]QAS52356.1 hypothetical protein HLI_08990 [Halobacillus litoralis]